VLDTNADVAASLISNGGLLYTHNTPRGIASHMEYTDQNEAGRL
jgi:hypothetical protein